MESKRKLLNGVKLIALSGWPKPTYRSYWYRQQAWKMYKRLNSKMFIYKNQG
jgi:hypothetical protein